MNHISNGNRSLFNPNSGKHMKEKTKELLEQIGEAHDWVGRQPRSSGGTELHWTEECQICGLRRHYQQDTQNGNPGRYRFSKGKDDLALLDALKVRCGEVHTGRHSKAVEACKFVLSVLAPEGFTGQSVLYSDALHPTDDNKTVVDLLREAIGHK